MLDEIKNIDEKVEGKEEYIEDETYNNNSNNAKFKINKPQIKQHLDSKKILLLIGSIVIVSALFIFTTKPTKKEEKEINNNVTPAKIGILDIEEETKNNEEKNDINTTEEIPEEINIKTLDEYDKDLGEDYSEEKFEITFDESETNVSEKEKKYTKSSISFDRNKNTPPSNNENNISQEQQYLMQQSTQNTQKNEIQDTSQNRQESKQKFIDTERKKSFYSKNGVTPALGKNEIKAGTMIPSVLITSINSDLPGEILAQVTSDVKDYRTLRNVLIPAGSKIIGRYDSQITYGQNRLLVVWDRIIFPNGNSLLLENYQGVDLLGNNGLKGKVNNHFFKLLRSVILSAGINMASSSLEDINVNVGSSDRARVTIGAGSKDAANNVESIGSRMIDKDLNQQPTIQIKKGTRFNIFVNSDIILPTYKK